MLPANNKHLTLLYVWYIIGFFHLGLFLRDFFPLKQIAINSIVRPPLYINDVSLNVSHNYQPQVDRIIFIIIDALRKDFVNNMPYIYSEISNKRACLLTVRAESPTVTMPRIKAMTTGNIPVFIDLILNLASTEITEDSFLHRAKFEGKNLVFYGDDTWLKLFPEIFLRSEGTTSFFATDFTEVDNNVTRHLNRELQQKDWHMLFLHYLGLDHIGHVHGPFHTLINGKLDEMDRIVKQIHTTVNNQNEKTLIVVCGDHGMRNTGGHGGSTDEETLIPLIFFHDECKSNRNEIRKQIDIAPTMAMMLGLTLPADNIGKIITDITAASHSDAKQLYLYHYNALNLIDKNPQLYHSDFSQLFHEHSELIKFGKGYSEQLISDYEQKINELSEKLEKSSTKQDILHLYLNFSALITVTLSLLNLSDKLLNIWTYFYLAIVVIQLLVLVSSIEIAKILCVIPFILFLYELKQFKYLTNNVLNKSSKLLLFLIGGTMIRTISFFSSSYIEKEQLIWFFLWGSVTVLGAYEEYKTKRSWSNLFWWFVLFSGLRLMRIWNHEPYLGSWLQESDNKIVLFCIFLISLFATNYLLTMITFNDRQTNILNLLTALSIIWYRISLNYKTQCTLEARIAMLFILLTSLIGLMKHRDLFKMLTATWILWIALLLKPHNVILIPIAIGSSKILFKICSSINCVILLHIWLAQILFYCQGFYNSLASVDISPGYIGLSDYSLFLTTFFIVCHTYAFQILTLLLYCITVNYPNQIRMIYVIILYRLSTITFYCFVVLIQREHLFIWSVFSPKLIIESSHTFGLLICLTIYMLMDKMHVGKKSINI